MIECNEGDQPSNNALVLVTTTLEVHHQAEKAHQNADSPTPHDGGAPAHD